MARQLIRAARATGDTSVPSADNISHNIYRWERGAVTPAERDNDLIIIEGLTGEQKFAASAAKDQVASYLRFFDLLREAASTGAEAGAIVERSLESLR